MGEDCPFPEAILYEIFNYFDISEYQPYCELLNIPKKYKRYLNSLTYIPDVDTFFLYLSIEQVVNLVPISLLNNSKIVTKSMSSMNIAYRYGRLDIMKVLAENNTKIPEEIFNSALYGLNEIVMKFCGDHKKMLNKSVEQTRFHSFLERSNIPISFLNILLEAFRDQMYHSYEYNENNEKKISAHIKEYLKLMLF